MALTDRHVDGVVDMVLDATQRHNTPLTAERLFGWYQRVHYEAPPAHQLDAEMGDFLNWFNGDQQDDPVIKAGLAHLWFVTIHPFEDGNGRIARAVGDLALARAEQSVQRFYSLSAQIQRERNDYYDRLAGLVLGLPAAGYPRG